MNERGPGHTGLAHIFLRYGQYDMVSTMVAALISQE